jgi:hypothetical protein
MSLFLLAMSKPKNQRMRILHLASRKFERACALLANNYKGFVYWGRYCAKGE